MEWAKRGGYARLWAGVWDWNLASRRVLEKLAFVEVRREPPVTHRQTLITCRELRPDR